MKRNPFISRLATSVAAVALAIGSTFTLSSCSDDDEVDNSGSKPVTRLEAPVVAEVADEDITENSLTFTWAAVEEATHYSAQVRLSETGDIYRETLTANTTVSFEGLTDGTKYYFRVRANNTYNESRNSAYSEWTVVETVAADPTRPTLPTPANPMCDMSKTTVSSLTFSWESVEGATAYNVVLTTIGKDDVTATTTGTSYTFTGLEKGVKYYFTVQAAEIEGYNASKFSGVINARTTAQLETPTGLTCTVKMSEAAKFEWEAVENAATYAFELYKNADQEPVMAGMLDDLGGDLVPGETIYATSTTNTSISFRGLERDTYYSLRVKAVPSGDAYLESGFTDYCVIKTLVTDATPLAAPALTIAEAQQLKATVTWTAVANALGYDYYYATADEIAAGDESVYVKGELRAIEADPAAGIEAGPCPTELVMKDLTPNTTYKLYVMTVADPANPTDGDSAYTELEVKTADLADVLTISTVEELEEVVGRMKDGGVVTIKAGNYFSTKTLTLTQGITFRGESASNRPHVNIKQITMGVAVCEKVRFADIVFTGYKVNGDGTLNTTDLAGLGGYFLDNSGQTGNIGSLEIENCVVYGGFKCAFLRMNRTNFGATNLIVKNNIVSVGGSDGAIIGANGKDFGASWVITGNTFDGIGRADYGNTKYGQMVRCPSSTNPDFSVEISNNTFYNISCVKSKDLFEAPTGTVTLSKNIVTIDTATTGAWAKGTGIKATLNSSDNFIFDTTSSIGGFTNADPEITGYVFLENYKPANAAVVAAGAGDPRWLK